MGLPRIGIISFRGPGQSATDRFRYDVLGRRLGGPNLEVEYFDWNAAWRYDVVVAPLKLNGLLPRVRRKAALVVGDLTDDMLAYPNWYHALGSASRILERFLQRRRYVCLMRECAWVVAGSASQQASFRRYALGVSVVSDALLDTDCALAVRHTRRAPCRLIWFGNVESLHGLASIQPALDALAERGDLELRLITSDELKFRFSGRWPRRAGEFMRAQRLPCEFCRWSPTTYSRDIAEGDIALVPVEPGTPYNHNKPPGRVLLALGLPVIASPIPAHEEVIEQGRTGYVARGEADWVETARALAASPEKRGEVGRAARECTLDHYGERRFVQRCADVIRRVLDGRYEA